MIIPKWTKPEIETITKTNWKINSFSESVFFSSFSPLSLFLSEGFLIVHVLKWSVKETHTHTLTTSYLLRTWLWGDRRESNVPVCMLKSHRLDYSFINKAYRNLPNPTSNDHKCYLSILSCVIHGVLCWCSQTIWGVRVCVFFQYSLYLFIEAVRSTKTTSQNSFVFRLYSKKNPNEEQKNGCILARCAH